MIEVFKTNVLDAGQAKVLVSVIHQNCADYQANFDLDDCDKILRVKSKSQAVQPRQLIDLLKDFGYRAEVLSDDAPKPPISCFFVKRKES
jgi:hypothetical protein